MLDPSRRMNASTAHLMTLVSGLAILLASCAPAPVSREGGSQVAAPSAAKVLRIGMQAQAEPARGTDGPPSPAPYGGIRPASSAGLEHFMTFHGALTKFDTASQVIPHLAEKVPTLQDGDWVLGNEMEGVAFDQYFLGRPKIDRLIIRYLGDVNVLIANLLSGDVDVAPLGAQLDPAQMVVIRQAWGDTGGTTLAIPKGVRSIYLQLRDPSAPWAQDVRVRQALLHALDRQEIVDTLLSGVGGVPEFFGAPEDPAYRLALQRGVPRYPYDSTRAERLLAEAGWTRGADRLLRNGAGETASIDLMSSAQGSNVQEAEAVASHWIAAGFQSRATPYPPTVSDRLYMYHWESGGLSHP